MHYLQNFEKDAPCVATTPSHTLLFPLPARPFLPNWHLFILHHLAEVSSSPQSLPGLLQQRHQPSLVPRHYARRGSQYLLLQRLLSVSPTMLQTPDRSVPYSTQLSTARARGKSAAVVHLRLNTPSSDTNLFNICCCCYSYHYQTLIERKAENEFFSWTARSKSIRMQSLSNTASVLRTQTCTLLKCIMIRDPNHRCYL